MVLYTYDASGFLGDGPRITKQCDSSSASSITLDPGTYKFRLIRFNGDGSGTVSVGLTQIQQECIFNSDCPFDLSNQFDSTTHIKKTLCNSPQGTPTSNPNIKQNTCYAPSNCGSSNNNCAANYCCTGAISESDNVCVGKNILRRSSSYICDPGTWMECSSENAGETINSAGELFECAQKNNHYQWQPIKQRHDISGILNDIFVRRILLPLIL